MKSCTVADIYKPSNVISVEAHASLQDAMKCLAAHKISSCPVLEKGKPVGWINWSCMITFLVDRVNAAREIIVQPPTAAMLQEDIAAMYETSGRHNIKTALGSKYLKKVQTVKESTYIRRVLNLLRSSHAVAVVDDKGHMLGVLSQRDLMKYLAENKNRIQPALRANTIRGLALANSVVCVRDSEIALDAFYSLAQAGWGGAGVINGNGTLVGNLSTSDLRLVGDAFDFGLLLKTVGDVVPAQKLVTSEATDTLEALIAALAQGNVHRVFLVDGQSPSAIVTITDVCRVLFQATPKQVKKKDDAKSSGGKGKSFKKHMEKEASKKGGKNQKKKKKNKNKKKKK